MWRVRDDGIGADTCGERQDFTGERNDRAVLERPRRSARIDHSPRNSVDADDVFAALTRTAGERAAPPENPMSADRVRWEHIQRVYEMCERNVSETARRLNMHRRTLQRILAKRAPR